MLQAPHWLFPLLVLILAQIALEVCGHRVMVEQTVARIPSTATRTECDVVRSELDAALPVDLSIVPFKEGSVAAAGAVVLGVVLAAWGTSHRPRFAQLFALCVGLALITCFENGAETAFLSVSPAIHGLPAFPWSALAFTDATGISYPVGLLLTTINLFTLWYVSALGRALAVLCNISTAHAVLIALVFRAVTAGCAIALLHLLRNAYAFII
jgi:hypothetical protein